MRVDGDDRRPRDERRLRLHGRALDRLRVPAGRRARRSGSRSRSRSSASGSAGEVAAEPLFDPAGDADPRVSARRDCRARVWPGGVDSDRAARRRDHEPQLQGRRRRRGLRAAGRRQATPALLGIDRDGRARARPSRPRALGIGPEVVAFVEPEGYLVTRFVEGEVGRGRRAAEARARCCARLHDGPPIPGPVRLVPRRRGLRGDRARPRRADCRPAYERGAGDRRTGSSGGAVGATLCPVPQRPPGRELHRRRRAALDRRLGVRRHGRPGLRPRELRRQQRPRRGRRPRAARAPTAPPTAARHMPDALHVRLPRGDVGRRPAGASRSSTSTSRATPTSTSSGFGGRRRDRGFRAALA